MPRTLAESDGVGQSLFSRSTWRGKTCFGNRSALGAETLGTNLSLLVTAKRQQRDPLQFLQALLLHGPAAAQPLLYRRPLPDTS
jgi:uncharacterized membrane protein YhfC